MEIEIIDLIKEMNPGLNDGEIIPAKMSEYIQREQTDKLLLPDQDKPEDLYLKFCRVC